MPARTLDFNLKIKIKGGSVTKAATASQVLEPDGKGGIETQPFTVGKYPLSWGALQILTRLSITRPPAPMRERRGRSVPVTDDRY